MKTFETEKHNMPEGATHYYHSCSDYGWVKKEPCATGRDKSFIWDGGKWVRGVVVSYAVNKIPPQPTYRYEKVTDSIFDLKEEFERGELFSFDGNEHYVQIETEGDFSYAHIYENLYRRIEVTGRELEIEAAKDLYDTYMLIWSNHYIAWDSLDDKNKKAFLAIVCKTGYRKDFNVVNGKG